MELPPATMELPSDESASEGLVALGAAEARPVDGFRGALPLVTAEEDSDNDESARVQLGLPFSRIAR